jgi:hypothetical protein
MLENQRKHDKTSLSSATIKPATVQPAAHQPKVLLKGKLEANMVMCKTRSKLAVLIGSDVCIDRRMIFLLLLQVRR